MDVHFKKEEFACKCGCGFDEIDKKLNYKLELARMTAKVPFVINSACRCKKHNKNVGGLPNSAHLRGLAVDIRATNSHNRFRIVRGLVMAGFQRIIIYEGFVHADVDPDKPQQILAMAHALT